MIETEDYWIYENKFIFKPDFNKSIDIYKDIICNCCELIFSNYNHYNITIETNNNYVQYYIDDYEK